MSDEINEQADGMTLTLEEYARRYMGLAVNAALPDGWSYAPDTKALCFGRDVRIDASADPENWIEQIEAFEAFAKAKPPGADRQHAVSLASGGWTPEKLAAAQAAALASCTELRPPPEHADKPGTHWLAIGHGGGHVLERPARWEIGSGGFWCLLGVGRAMYPAEMAELGYRYLGPAEWDAGSWQREQALRSASNEVIQAAANRIAELEADNDRYRSAMQQGAVAMIQKDKVQVERIAALEAENARLATGPVPEVTPEQVAKFWMDRERSYYGTQFGHFAHARLSEVIRAARWHGRMAGAAMSDPSGQTQPTPQQQHEMIARNAKRLQDFWAGHSAAPATAPATPVAPAAAPTAPAKAPLPAQALRGGNGVPR